MIRASGIARNEPIIDIGAGASVLVDELLNAGFEDVSVLDISERALAIGKSRLGTRAARVQGIALDVLSWEPSRCYGLWHDRAVFHFLTEAADRAAYRAGLEKALQPGGALIMAGFAPDGPERCSGLPVQRWSPDALAAELGADFQLIEHRREEHHTPGGARQNFIWCRFTRR
jgi:trans-aconitate methyltransferase